MSHHRELHWKKWITPHLQASAIATIAWLGLACAEPVRAQELTPTEKATLLEEIEKIEKKLSDSRMRNNIRVLGQLREAVTSHSAALKYHLQCLKNLEWTEKGKRESEWREWRDGEDDFKDSGYAKARQFQIRYLILTIEASILDEDDDAGRGKVLKELVGFLTGMVSNYEDVANHADVLREGVLSSDIAKDTKLSITLDKPKRWADAPLSINAIYEDSILPFYRKQRNAAGLRTAWEARISQLRTVAGTVEKVKISTRASGGAFGARRNARRSDGSTDRERVREEREEKAEEAAERLAEFEKDEAPDLEWEMERDAFVFGTNRSAAARKLGSHITSHLDHPSAPGWIAELKKLASGDFKVEDYLPEEGEEDS